MPSRSATPLTLHAGMGDCNNISHTEGYSLAAARSFHFQRRDASVLKACCRRRSGSSGRRLHRRRSHGSCIAQVLRRCVLVLAPAQWADVVLQRFSAVKSSILNERLTRTWKNGRYRSKVASGSKLCLTVFVDWSGCEDNTQTHLAAVRMGPSLDARTRVS